MNKMAIFVEGYTEVVFVDKLIREVAEKNAVLIQWRRIDGGTTCARRNLQIQAEGPHAGKEHFFVIHDCGGDDAVKARMTEEYLSLSGSGYSRIVCIRDVYPRFQTNEIPDLEKGLPLFVRTKPIVVDFILSIMEVEAWFLAEYTHFAKIDSKITVPAIVAACGFDPANDDMQLRAVGQLMRQHLFDDAACQAGRVRKVERLRLGVLQRHGNAGAPEAEFASKTPVRS